MMLVQLIQKGALQRLAAATTATVATPPRLQLHWQPLPVAGVATVAVATGAQHDTESIREWWLERSAIMAVDAGLPEDEAVQQAWVRTCLRFGLPLCSPHPAKLH